MSDIQSLFSALGGSGLADPNMIFVGRFLIWFVLACVLCKFLAMIFPSRR